MASGKFSDLAEREHTKQTSKQKMIIFGERPMNLIDSD